MSVDRHESIQVWGIHKCYRWIGFGLLAGLSGPLLAQSLEDEDTAPTSLPTLTVWGQGQSEDTDAYAAQRTTVASKLPVAPREIPQSVSVITRQRIEDQNLNTLEDALRQTPGVTVIPNDTAQSQYWSRGYGLNVSIDGVASTGGLSGAEQFDLAVYDRVEVLRGPSGVLQGSGDLGGTVNVVTKKPRAQFGLDGSISAGSWDNQRGELDITGPLDADGRLRGRFVGVGQDRDFFYDRTHQRKWVGHGVLELDLNDALTLSLAHTRQDNDIDVPFSGLPVSAPGGTAGRLLDVSRATTPYPDWSYNRTHTRETVLAAEQRFANDWSLTAKLRYLSQDSEWKDAVPGAGGVDLSDHTFSYVFLREYQGDSRRRAADLYASGPFRLLGREHQALIGYNQDDYRVRSSDTWGSNRSASSLVGSAASGLDLANPDLAEPSLVRNRGAERLTEQSGVYGQLRLRLLDPLTLVAGGRLSDYDYKSRSRSPSTPTAWSQGESSDDEFTPYGGLVYQPIPQASLYASYSDIFIPQNYEKAGGGTLAPRVGKQYEVGIKTAFFDEALNATLAAFRIRDENRPFEDPNAPNYYIAAGEVESRGWELEVNGRPLPGWDISAGYTHLKTRYLKDDSNAGLFSHSSPKHSLKLWSHYRFPGGALKGLALGAGVTASSAYGSDRFASDRKQSGYALVSAVASYALNEHLTLALNGENLSDRTYYASLGNNTYNTYGEPRHFTLSLRASY
ncbi:outer-membrane receptor for ferric coprogen and ferric-rhodotorulic acid [Pseudomonas flavescens]|uniref:Outer-membrane receptor for ferric coprogen and ferric-rhodotorulic acid n=1 Tax=Phytopseudomonas flavescens TaxID=29435 RepID=A0A1G8E8G2_9GAMM|nr:TonB-dependent siderophore receptor [Pseudomonas flavescens]SDH66216.1 outer-membrane receptor for ferric coprogen and ferric-rhodotorulic acid [Pseudomonas flavescens]